MTGSKNQRTWERGGGRLAKKSQTNTRPLYPRPLTHEANLIRVSAHARTHFEDDVADVAGIGDAGVIAGRHRGSAEFQRPRPDFRCVI